jgi:hypothetical protein
MKDIEAHGHTLRWAAKALVFEYITKTEDCQPHGDGMKQADIFRNCGLDWGDYPQAPSTQQQYWVVALLRELEKERRIERVSDGGPWRLR